MRGGIFFGRAEFYGVSGLSKHGRTVTALENLAKAFSFENKTHLDKQK
jgi:hypothetical protein